VGFGVTAIFYLVIGSAVATAVFLAESGSGLEKAFRLATAVLFWPIYLPVLLARPQVEKAQWSSPPAVPHDELAVAIAQVESELDRAFSSLDGWAEDVLAREDGRIRELRGVWTTQASRIREMDELLAEAEFEQAGHDGSLRTSGGAGSDDRHRQSDEARRANFARLRQIRAQAHADLLGTLAWVRELVSMIHLAKFTGAPASRAEELVAQIAAAVEGVSAVTVARPTSSRFRGEFG
jgi:hypothetical protein